MIQLKQFVFSLFFLLFFAQFIFSTQVNAQEHTKENFDTRIETTYTVSREGNTKVSHHLRIINKTPTIYLKQYALKTSYFGLQNITVKSGQTEIPANIVSNQNGTSIGITFADDVVGQGKVRDFTIEYSNPNLAMVAGKVLEVHIPKLGDDASFDSNRTILFTPVFFSLPVRVTPEPSTTDFEQTQTKTVFENSNEQAISAIFGTEQNYAVTLRYQLENPASSPAIAQIALPPDTQYQRMHYHNLDPLPNDLKQDSDGNWIASYRIPASSAVVVYLTAEVKVTLEPNTTVPITPVQNSHTQSDKYWESNHNFIQQKAVEFPTAESIYTHVVNSLTYSKKDINIDTLNRYGAVGAFANNQDAVCQEFTDSFIAIARAANIPSRRLVGYAHSQNSTLRPLSFAGDVLHAWPEYYNSEQGRWIQVDPTWGNTTNGIDYFNLFDLNHIVFAINGSSSTLPNPAGSYKLETQTDTKDIDVTISENIFPQIGPEISTRAEQKKFFFIPIPGMFTFYITNQTGQAWYNIESQIKTVQQNIEVSVSENGAFTLLPFETKKLDVTFFTTGLSAPQQSEITVNYIWKNTGETLYEPAKQLIISGPQFITIFQEPQTYIYLGVGFITITLITGSILVYRSRLQGSLRRKS